MKTKSAAILATLLCLAVSAFAHRLDEYLQATIISLEQDRVHASMRLIPGVAVYHAVLASIDTNHDGVISETEARDYAALVLHDLSLSIDHQPLTPRLLSVNFPPLEDMQEGLGEIHIEFTADLPSGGSHRRLVIENHHQSAISAYLVNCLVPQDRNIQVVAQNRNQNQSFYELDYAQTPVPSSAPGNLGVIPSMFRLGMRHIAEGTDHLLFLLALLIPAPLLAISSRWAGFAGARHTLLQIVRAVTAFTIGHSITLALAAFGLVHAPSRPIEVLIAVSILVSAMHALRPLFPGREAVIAAFFGLIHGLAFAATLAQLGLDRWQRVAAILGFNLGIETMQLIVVAATLPSLLLLSRTRAYSIFRIGGALFASLASLGWIAERLLNLHNSVDFLVAAIAHRAIWMAAILFLTSVVFRFRSRVFPALS